MTHGRLSADTSSPRGRGICHAKVFLLTKWTTGRFGYKVSRCGFCAFELDEAFCAEGLEAAS